MGSINRVFLMGNLTRDPELRKTPSGVALSAFGIAVNESYKNKTGDTVETTCFADVVTWGRQAEACGQYLKKGAPIFVEGRLQMDQWKTENGENRSRLKIRADRVQFLGVRRDGKGTGKAADVQPDDEAVPVEDGAPY